MQINKNWYLDRKKSYKFILNVYYEDLLNNWYYQKSEFNYNPEDLIVQNPIVEQEKLIEK